VSFVKDIFDRVESVAVWLGEENACTSHAISLIRGVAKIANKERYVIRYAGRNKLPIPNQVDWVSLQSSCRSTWFRRVWLVQKVANKNVHIVTGRHEITFA